jgi:hypothetical protein
VPELKLGYQGPLYGPWYDWAKRYASSYAFLLGTRDGYYGADEARFTKEMQRRLGIVQDGVFGDRTASAAGYTWPGATKPPVVEGRRPIWFYSCPGSGADWWMGPSYDVGQMVAGTGWNEPGRQSLRINHQPVAFQKGGYLGLMGGDPRFSYLDVIADQLASLRYLLQNNPDVQAALTARRKDPKARVEVELWFSGYSQSADGLRDAILALFGDGGEFELIRDRINGLILFGDPCTPGTGIARKTYPAWLEKLVTEVNATVDFYAVAKDRIRPAFYREVIKAEMELPFLVHVIRLAVPIIEDWAKIALPFLAPLLGGFGPAAQMGLSAIGGLASLGGNADFTRLLGMAGSNEDTDTTDDIRKILSPTGILNNIPDLITLLGQVGPGLEAHNSYHAICAPRPEFADAAGHPRVGTQYAYDVVAAFRR